MRRFVLIAVLLLLPAAAAAWTLSWDPVTTYTDGVPITDPVTYDVWVDGVQIASGITQTSIQVPDPGHNVAHRYEVSAVVAGVSSAKARLDWTSPFGTPAQPANLKIEPR